jgi:hypothetical protein
LVISPLAFGSLRGIVLSISVISPLAFGSLRGTLVRCFDAGFLDAGRSDAVR